MANDFNFLDAGETGTLVRRLDWTASPLGPPEAWPQSLRSVVGLLLGSKFPMFVAWGPELGFLYNDSYAEILGAKHPAAMGARFHDIWAEIWPDIEPLIDAAMRGEASFREDLPLVMNRRGYDEQTWFTFSYSPVRDESGRVAGMFCACHETTPRVLSAQRQTEETERQRRMFEQAPGFICTLRGPEHIFDFANDAHKKLFGDRGTGKPVREAFPDLAGQVFYDLLDKVYTTGERHVALAQPVRFRPAPGAPEEARFIDFIYAPLTDDTGRIVGVFCEGQDVTETYRMQEAMRRLNETLEQRVAERTAQLEVASAERARLASLAENSPDFIGIWDLDLQVLYVNPAGRRLVGIESDAELKRRTPPEYFPPEERDRVAREVLPTVLEKGHWVGELTFAHFKTGERIPVLYDVFRINDPATSAPSHYATVTRDLRERNRAEDRLRQAQKMEAVGQLTGGLAHDFNNLLTAVIGNLELLDARLGPDERMRKLVQSAMRAAERGATLTGQLLAFSRRQHLASRPVDLDEVVGGMTEMLARTLGGTVEVRAALAGDLWPALVDATQIEVALLNLAINARDAMPFGGTVLIGTRNVVAGGGDRPEDLPPGDFVVVFVTDAGEGMAPEVLARAFEPFFTTKEIGKGTGLGLSQVYGLARQSGGTARIRSGRGQGTTVEIYLPRAPEQAGERRAVGAGEAAAAAQPLGRGRVLVVDDQVDVREIVCAHLETLGYGTLQAVSGRGALDLLRTGDAKMVELLLVDYAMPAVTGIEVIRAARQTRPDLPVVLMTGYADALALGEPLPAGVTLLKKPYRLHELAAALEHAPRIAREIEGGGNVFPLDRTRR